MSMDVIEGAQQGEEGMGNGPLFPKVPELFHCACCAPHARKEDVYTAVCDTPESIAEIEGAVCEFLGMGIIGVLG